MTLSNLSFLLVTLPFMRITFFLLNTFQILQITAIENEIDNRTVPAPFVKFVGQPNTEISSQAMTAITWTQKICN